MYAGDIDRNTMHRLGNANHDGKAIPGRQGRRDRESCPRPLICACLFAFAHSRACFSSSFAKISCRASSSYATAEDPGSSSSFVRIATITMIATTTMIAMIACWASSSSAPRPQTRPHPSPSQRLSQSRTGPRHPPTPRTRTLPGHCPPPSQQPWTWPGPPPLSCRDHERPIRRRAFHP